MVLRKYEKTSTNTLSDPPTHQIIELESLCVLVCTFEPHPHVHGRSRALRMRCIGAEHKIERQAQTAIYANNWIYLSMAENNGSVLIPVPDGVSIYLFRK